MKIKEDYDKIYIGDFFMTTISYKISENLRNEIIDFYKDRAIANNPPYSTFQVKDIDCVTTLYDSGKIVFQGLGADIEASFWIEQERIKNNRYINSELKKEKDKKDKKNEELNDNRFKYISTVGSDEVGTGDYFGPIIVTASYVDINYKTKLENLGIKDSKKLTDEKILSIAPILIKEIPHVTFKLFPNEYNEKGITNMNAVKAILHNKALFALISKNNFNYDKIVIDQFVYPKKYFEHIEYAKNKITNITFTTHAEDKCLSVAVSSIISRYRFLQYMDELSNKLGINLKKGAGLDVDKQGIEIVKKYGFEKLKDIAKLNFKNTEKIKSQLN